MRNTSYPPRTTLLERYVLQIVREGLESKGFEIHSLEIGCGMPVFDIFQWFNHATVYVFATRDGDFYEMDGLAEAWKVVGRPEWKDAKVGLRVHCLDPEGHIELDQFDVEYLEITDRHHRAFVAA